MEELKSNLSWSDAKKILEERYKKEYDVQNLTFNYFDEKVTDYCDDHDGFPPEKVTYTARRFSISFVKNAGLITIPCVIKKSSTEVKNDLEEEVSKILDSENCKLDRLIIWGCAFGFEIEYKFHIKSKNKQKILK